MAIHGQPLLSGPSRTLQEIDRSVAHNTTTSAEERFLQSVEHRSSPGKRRDREPAGKRTWRGERAIEKTTRTRRTAEQLC